MKSSKFCEEGQKRVKKGETGFATGACCYHDGCRTTTSAAARIAPGDGMSPGWRQPVGMHDSRLSPSRQPVGWALFRGSALFLFKASFRAFWRTC